MVKGMVYDVIGGRCLIIGYLPLIVVVWQRPYQIIDLSERILQGRKDLGLVWLMLFKSNLTIN